MLNGTGSRFTRLFVPFSLKTVDVGFVNQRQRHRHSRYKKQDVDRRRGMFGWWNEYGGNGCW